MITHVVSAPKIESSPGHYFPQESTIVFEQADRIVFAGAFLDMEQWTPYIL
jgi:hypothetical protein